MIKNILNNNKVVNAFNILVIAPILYLVANDRFPQEYKKYLLYLAILLAAFNLYQIVNGEKVLPKIQILPIIEGMAHEVECGKPYVHCIRLFDSSPGYSEPVIQAKVNDTVIWKNIGEVNHTVTSTGTDKGMHPDGLFDSGNLRPGQEFAVKFLQPGEYFYYCVYNKGWMRGKIVVTEPPKEENN